MPDLRAWLDIDELIAKFQAVQGGGERDVLLTEEEINLVLSLLEELRDCP